MQKFGSSINVVKILEKLRRGVHIFPSGNDVSRLAEVVSFGFNPGNLRMFAYVPSSLPKKGALVVILHGCGQTAAGYDYGAGWSTLADRYGFAVLLPEQQRSNNPNGCFNWFLPGDTQRGQGEAASIRQMIEKMVREHGIDPESVFITGLSAGGAMTSVMLACYPDVFAAGAIIAGLPFGAASNVQEALKSMLQCPSRPARYWGDLVRQAAPRFNSKWPRVSVWHGDADQTVVPSNAGEIIKQWTDLHGVSNDPSAETTVEGYPRKVWLNGAGQEVIESYVITRMAHGAPLATGVADTECGSAGPFLLEVGISSSFHIATFFGVTAHGVRVKSAGATSVSSSDSPSETALSRNLSVSAIKRQSRVDIATVIAKALQVAGLTK